MPIHTSVVSIGEIPLRTGADRHHCQQNRYYCFDAREKHFFTLTYAINLITLQLNFFSSRLSYHCAEAMPRR